MMHYPRIDFFHKETRKIGNIPFDEALWPDSWKKVEYKEYPRFSSYRLPAAALPSIEFKKVLETRASRRNFDAAATLSAEQLSTVLKFAGGISRDNGNPKEATRYYPSGGARYPLELYLAFRGNETIPAGVYHYNVRAHSLEQIGGEAEDRQLRELPTYTWVKDAAMIGFITAVFDRSMRKYAERGYRFTLVEAGIVLESFYLVANAQALGCCAVGSNNDMAIESILDIDGTEESFLQQFAVGPTLV